MHTIFNRTTPSAPKAGALAIICVLLLVAACSNLSTTADDKPFELSGLIEGDKITISSELGGTVVEVLVDEGDEVMPGDVLIRLDDTLLQAALGEAQSQIESAQASRDLVAAGPRSGEIAAAQAVVAAAQAARDGALQAWHNAINARDNPQELSGRIAGARTELEMATYQVEQAGLELQAAELKRNQTQEGSDERRVHDAQVRAAASGVAAAEAARDGVLSGLNQLLAIRREPLAAEALVRAAADQYDIAVADLRLANARLEELLAGSDEAEIAVADALVHQAQAAADVVVAQLDLTALTAPPIGPTRQHAFGLVDGEPIDDGHTGVVSARMVNEGQAVTPGAPLLVLMRLDPLHLTVYVPTDRIGHIGLGQVFEVRVASFPDQVFRGQVFYIAPQAEFTPHSTQTRQERVKAVFAVRLRLSNADGWLKPGMPADAVIR